MDTNITEITFPTLIHLHRAGNTALQLGPIHKHKLCYEFVLVQLSVSHFSSFDRTLPTLFCVESNC